MEHKDAMSFGRFALLSLLLWSVPACKEDQACVPGKSEGCVGPGGCAGAQVCDSEGRQYGACVCAANDAGGDSADDATVDSVSDSGMDASVDSAVDTEVDATVDAVADVAVDTAVEATADSVVDAATDAAEVGDAGPCDLFLQTGCASGQKCMSIEPSSGADPVNTCVPTGTVAEGASCVTTPSDNCAPGLACVDGQCRKYCDRAVTTSCASTYGCDGFVVGSSAGTACIPRCDPVTQVRLTDGAAACGSATPTAPERGCYGTPDMGFRCAPTASFSTKRHGENASEGGGTVYLNSCAPGYAPLIQKTSSSTSPVICVAFCRPNETHTSSTASAGGVAPNTCAARGATGAECRYLWFLQKAGKTVDSNTVGFCMDYASYTYDHDSNPSTAELTYPSCTTLANTDTDGDGVAEHLEFACAPTP